MLKRIQHLSVPTVVVAILTALMVTLTPPQAFAATPGEIDPSQPVSLTITKLEQPEQFGDPAPGHPVPDLAEHTPVPDVSFSATEVPLGQPIHTIKGWEQARKLTIEEARALTATLDPTVTMTTDHEGVAHTDTLRVGLYLIEETEAPEGVVPAEPFLVTLPHTPSQHDPWNYDVYVYPKNARVSVDLLVDDADTTAPPDVVTWTAYADVPKAQSLSTYKFTQEIDPSLDLATQTSPADDFSVTLTGQTSTELHDGTHYTLSTVARNSTAYVIEFTEAGRNVLQETRAGDPFTRVRVDYQTRVLAEGALRNEAHLTTSTGNGKATEVFDSAETRYGPIGIEVVERGAPKHRIPGATFQVYRSESDAGAQHSPITIDGQQEWVSDGDDPITLTGLRFSHYVDGETRLPSDSRYREYWVVMTGTPDGWNGSADPLPVAVLTTDHSQMQVAVFELERLQDGETSPGPPWLPNTGSRSLALLGALLLVGAGVIIVLRRKRETQ